MNNIRVTIGQYIPGKSWVYKLDPRFKIIATILLMIIIFLIPELWMMGMVAGVFLFMMVSGRLPIMRFIRGLKPILFLAVFSFVLQLGYTKTGTLLYEQDMQFGLYHLLMIIGIILFWFFTSKWVKLRFIYMLLAFCGVIAVLSLFRTDAYVWSQFHFSIFDEGLMRGSFFVSRMILVLILTTLLTMTTSTNYINHGIEAVMKPLKAIRVPVGEIAMMLSLTLRFIPTLLLETNKILNAQASRGIDFNEGSFVQKVKQIITLLIPMFVVSLKRAEDLADAMESRGYVIGGKRTSYDAFRFGLLDYLGVVFLIGSFVAVLTARIMG